MAVFVLTRLARVDLRTNVRCGGLSMARSAIRIIDDVDLILNNDACLGWFCLFLQVWLRLQGLVMDEIVTSLR